MAKQEGFTHPAEISFRCGRIDNHATETAGDTKLALYLKAINEYYTMITAREAETLDQNRKRNPEVGNKPVA